MDDRAHLHNNEQLLVSMQPSRVLLVRFWLQALVEAFMIGAVLSLIALIAWFRAYQEAAPLWIYPLIFLLAYFLLCLLKRQLWKSASLRVTTERLLLQFPGTFFSKPLKTIKWQQFQEAYTKRDNVLDLFAGTKSLCIRYGTAQGELTSCFASLPFAQDLKHYIDKVDSAVRSNQTATLTPFVPKPRGQRDAGNET